MLNIHFCDGETIIRIPDTDIDGTSKLLGILHDHGLMTNSSPAEIELEDLHELSDELNRLLDAEPITDRNGNTYEIGHHTPPPSMVDPDNQVTTKFPYVM